MIVDAFLAALVLLDLLFIHVTGIVPGAWSAGFAAVIVAAPWVRRLAERLAWRIAWDLVVIVLFASLVLRTVQHGVERMLESGLILAMFCQVHLVNNLSRRQRPDLLLFNSFVIAVITAFFAQEVSYCAVFVAYAYTFTITWKLVAWRDAPDSRLGPLLRASVRQATCVLAVTGAVFLFWPRDFEREGLVTTSLLRARQGSGDLADHIGMQRQGGLQSDQIIMRIHGEAPVPAHWRTTTFQVFDAAGWHADRALQADRRRGEGPLWRAQGAGTWLRPGCEGDASFEVECAASGGRVPLPLGASLVALDPVTGDVPHMPLADGTIAMFGVPSPLRYTAECGLAVQKAGGRFAREERARLAPWLGLWRGPAQRTAQDLAMALRAGLPEDVDQVTLVEELRSHLETEFTYGLPGKAGSARTLDEFFRSRRGHCEFFASALALMLRSVDVPCRVVGGFLAVESDDNGRVLVRARHAHAWVEVLDPRAGWTTIDPTPAGLDERSADDDGGLLATLRAAWRRVADFSGADRRSALAFIADLPARGVRMASTHPVAGLLLAAALALGLVVRRRPRAPLAVRAYCRLVRRLRLPRLPGETPRQRLARARAQGLDAPALASLEKATHAHECARYRRERAVPSK